MTNHKYPGIFERVKAAIIDSIALVIFMIVITDIFSFFDSVSNSARIIAFIFIFILYDPILTSFFGGTLGHKVIGLRVKMEKDERKNIFFHLAIVRFIIKISLGWISLITISQNNKRKALHVKITGSLVIYK
jgi:uncharacterized RDD family membrane protein YckC